MPASPRPTHCTTPAGRRSILVMKHSYSQDGGEACRGEVYGGEVYGEGEEDGVMADNGPTTSRNHLHQQQLREHGVHRTLSNEF